MTRAIFSCFVLSCLAAEALAQRPASVMEEVGRDNLPAQKLGVDDLVAICRPKRMTVVGDFSARGGITTTVTATYTATT